MSAAARTYMLDFLRELDLRIPPPHECHHAFMRLKYGSDDTNWTEKMGLAVKVTADAPQLIYFLDEQDFAKSPAELAQDIFELVQSSAPFL